MFHIAKLENINSVSEQPQSVVKSGGFISKIDEVIRAAALWIFFCDECFSINQWNGWIPFQFIIIS